MRKTMTDEQLEEMGLLTRKMYEQAIETWKIAMKTMAIGSRQYRQVCAAGKAAQRLHESLKTTAEDREWSYEKMQQVFLYIGCNFS